MHVNKAIVFSALGITSMGVVRAWTSTPKQGITRVMIGGYLFALFLSLADMFGGGVSQIAGALALLALVAVFLSEGLPILIGLGNVVGFTFVPPQGGGSAGIHPVR